MSLLEVVIALLVVGLLLWGINKYLPLEAGIKTLLNVAVVLIMVLWLFRGLGGCEYLAGIHT